MNDFQLVADRAGIEALRGEFADAATMRDYVRVASLFTEDGVWPMADVDIEFVGVEEIRAGVEQMQNRWEYFVQNTHPGFIRLDGDTATERAYILEFGKLQDGRSQLRYLLDHDRYRRTPMAGGSPSASTRSNTSTPLR